MVCLQGLLGTLEWPWVLLALSKAGLLSLWPSSVLPVSEVRVLIPPGSLEHEMLAQPKPWESLWAFFKLKKVPCFVSL
jgi:hypothetical protein